jgi:hypothetical protein
MKCLLIIITAFISLSCKEKEQEIKNIETNIIEKQQNKIIFNRVETISTTQDDSFFIFKDNSTLLISQLNGNQYFVIDGKYRFLTKSFLESANTTTYLYSYKNEKILIVEGNDYYAGVFYVYYFYNENLYEIGTFNLRYPKIEEDPDSGIVNFNIEKNETNDIIIMPYVKKQLVKKYIFKSSVNKLMKVENLNTDWIGEYEISPMIVSQHRGEVLEVKYLIKIDSDTHAILEIESTYHQDNFCQGEHELVLENNILHAVGKCKETGAEEFYIKKDNDKYFIKSRRFVNQDWQELKKIK